MPLNFMILTVFVGYVLLHTVQTSSLSLIFCILFAIAIQPCGGLGTPLSTSAGLVTCSATRQCPQMYFCHSTDHFSACCPGNTIHYNNYVQCVFILIKINVWLWQAVGHMALL